MGVVERCHITPSVIAESLRNAADGKAGRPQLVVAATDKEDRAAQP
jgi:hypothetical protein